MKNKRGREVTKNNECPYRKLKSDLKNCIN